MYRILIATSGSFYVQKLCQGRWIKVGRFFNSKKQAREYVRTQKLCMLPYVSIGPTVVEYL